MSTRSFLLSLVLGLAGAAALFALATLLDVPALRYVGLFLLLGVVVARGQWIDGSARAALTWLAVIAGAVLLALAIERLT